MKEKSPIVATDASSDGAAHDGRSKKTDGGAMACVDAGCFLSAMRFHSILLPSFTSLLLVAGCSSAPGEDVGAAGEDLTASPFVGYFELDGTNDNDTWIEQLALHEDGTFEANMGNDVSNLSGHHFATSGTYHLAHGALTLHALGDFAGDYRYDLVLDGTTLHVHDASSRFDMQKRSITTITFRADWTMSQSAPLVANQPFLLRYAASRDDCAVPSGGGLDVVAFGRFTNGVTTSITQPFGTTPAHGWLGAFGSVPALGTELDVWFAGRAVDHHGTLTSCTHWDSNLGKNYRFAIQ